MTTCEICGEDEAIGRVCWRLACKQMDRDLQKETKATNMSEQNYRLLRVGEKVCCNDEYYNLNQVWEAAFLSDYQLCSHDKPHRRPCVLAPEPIAFSERNPHSGDGEFIFVFDSLNKRWLDQFHCNRSPRYTHWCRQLPAPVQQPEWEKAFEKYCHGEDMRFDETTAGQCDRIIAKAHFGAGWKAAGGKV